MARNSKHSKEEEEANIDNLMEPRKYCEKFTDKAAKDQLKDFPKELYYLGVDEGPSLPCPKEAAYTNWSESVIPLSDCCMAGNLTDAIVVIANLAAKGMDSLNKNDVQQTVKFLSTIRDNHGEQPPNISRFIEHVTHLTNE